MSYSVKKAGVAFKTKLGTNADLTGQAANFSAYYIEDATGTKTDILTAFTEDTNTAGLYIVDTTIATAGDYTIVINNSTIGMGNHEAPVVVVNATIDDVKLVVDDLATTIATVAADVDGLNGDTLLSLKDDIAAVSALINDGDTSGTATTVLDFVTQINNALSGGGSGLSALEGFTDDIENMLVGTEFLADGTTANPFYDATNPGVAKESSLQAALVALQGNITASQTALELAITTAKDAVIVKTDALQVVADANKALLEDAGFGLGALKVLIDDISTGVQIAETNILNVLNDATNGLVAIKTELVTRFDSVDAKLLTIEGKVEAGSTSTSFSVFA